MKKTLLIIVWSLLIFSCSDFSQFVEVNLPDLEVYTVTFNAQEGSAVDPLEVPENGLIPEPEAPQRQNFFFRGWYNDESCTEPWDFETQQVKAHMTLYALWEAYPVFQIDFYTAGGSAVDSQQVILDGFISEPENPQLTDHYFAGWFDQPQDGTAWSFSDNPVQGEMTLYAQWTDYPVYTVSFNSQGGSVVDSQQVILGHLASEPTAPTLHEHQFQGWYSDAGYSTPWDFSQGSITEDVELHAKWLINSYRVTFVCNGGEPLAAVDVPYGGQLAQPVDPLRYGYALLDWHSASVLNQPFDFSADTITENITLHAEWEILPGAQEPFQIDGVAFNMNIVPGGHTFPTGENDDGVATVADPYWIGETEVTYELWKAVYDWATTGTEGVGAGMYSFANPGREGSAGIDGAEPTVSYNHAVTRVNWRDSVVWCNAITEWYNYKNGEELNCYYFTDASFQIPLRDSTNASADNPVEKVFSNGFRLLSSNEWELAARWRRDSINTVLGYSNPWFTSGRSASGATTTTGDFSLGNGEPARSSTEAVAIFSRYMTSSGSAPTGIIGTSDVGNLMANDLGLYDISGNVWEWCDDGVSTDQKQIRGGAWFNEAIYLNIGFDIVSSSTLVYEGDGLRIARNAQEANP